MKTTAYTDAAMALVREYEPATHAAMVAADWTVETVTPRTLWSSRNFERGGLGFVLQVGEGFAGGGLALTLTARDNPGASLGADALTLVSPMAVYALARETHTSRDVALAGVLVHEYAHTVQPTWMSDVEREREAYLAGAEFLRKAGAERLAAHTLDDMQAAVDDLLAA